MSDHAPRTVERHCDVAVVGGSAAGLAAALQLGRQRRSVIVVDAGEPRNAPAAHMHGYLGREGIPPSELIAVGREEVRSYGGEVLAGRVQSGDPHRRRPLPRRARRRPLHRRSPGARRHRSGGRAPGHRRPGRALGSRRHPLPVLPRLRGPRPAHRPDRHPPDGPPHRRVVPPADAPGSPSCSTAPSRWTPPSSMPCGPPGWTSSAATCSRIVTGDDGHLAAVELADGGRIDADAVAVGPGSGCAPNRSRRSVSDQRRTRAGSETSSRPTPPGRRRCQASTRPAT